MNKWTVTLNALAIGSFGMVALAQQTVPADGAAAVPVTVEQLEVQTPADGPIHFVQDRERGDNAERGEDGPRGRRGNFDPERFREMMEQRRTERAERMREGLGVEDDAEWKVISEKIDAVNEQQRNVRSYSGRGFGRQAGPGRGGPGRGGEDADRGDRPQRERSEGEIAVDNLRDTLENEDASADDIKAALQKLRDGREKAEAALEATRQSLRELVTARQEAQLVVAGILE